MEKGTKNCTWNEDRWVCGRVNSPLKPSGVLDKSQKWANAVKLRVFICRKIVLQSYILPFVEMEKFIAVNEWNEVNVCA